MAGYSLGENPDICRTWAISRSIYLRSDSQADRDVRDTAIVYSVGWAGAAGFALFEVLDLWESAIPFSLFGLRSDVCCAVQFGVGESDVCYSAMRGGGLVLRGEQFADAF